FDFSDDENSVIVFPNPSNGLINVEGCEFCDYKVYSSDGKLFRSDKVKNQTVYIKDKGKYIISFQRENRTMSKLVIVE
ncbi:MAG: T9SS type A sorting domain-containing protein, partial [Bacteroidota bacterium]